MKKISVIMFVFCLSFVFGQKVSDFKYVSVPEKFPTFKDNYGLGVALTKFLKEKKYIIVPADKQEWPSEAKENPCNVVNVDILNDSGFLRNKVTLQFKDCNDKAIFSSKGSTNIKEYEEGYKDALQQSMISVPVSNPVAVTMTTSPIESISEINQTIVADKKAEKYTNGNFNLQRIQIGTNQFILADANSSVPYATFKATTKKDVFRVKLSNGDSTLGYFEAGNIVIEIPQSNGEYSKEVFFAK